MPGFLCERSFTRDCGGMNAKLQRIEVERAILGDDDFAVEHAARRQL